MEKNSHDVGVLLTVDVIGKTLYSHSAARHGKLVKLYIRKVGYTHTEYETSNGEKGMFATGNQGKGGKNWEAVSFSVAKAVALKHLEKKVHCMREQLKQAENEKNKINRTYPDFKDRLCEDPDNSVTISSSMETKDGVFDEFYDKRFPPEGFKYPELGCQVISLANYSVVNELTIPAGAVGKITCIRLPGTFASDPGYIGCGMYFKEIASRYIKGIIVPWDLMTYFKFQYN